MHFEQIEKTPCQATALLGVFSMDPWSYVWSNEHIDPQQAEKNNTSRHGYLLVLVDISIPVDTGR